MEDTQTHHQKHAQKSSTNQETMQGGKYDFTAANMSQSARNLVAAVLSNDVIINAQWRHNVKNAPFTKADIYYALCVDKH